MKLLGRLLLLLLFVVALSMGGLSCGSGSVANPPQLWLAMNGDELHVKLQAIEPHPF